MIVGVSVGAFVVGSVAAALLMLQKWKVDRVKDVERTRRQHAAYTKLVDAV